LKKEVWERTEKTRHFSKYTIMLAW